MDTRFKAYESGDEWHYLSRQLGQKYGYDWSYRFGFDPRRLTAAELRRYMSVYGNTIRARLGSVPLYTEAMLTNPVAFTKYLGA